MHPLREERASTLTAPAGEVARAESSWLARWLGSCCWTADEGSTRVEGLPALKRALPVAAGLTRAKRKGENAVSLSLFLSQKFLDQLPNTTTAAAAAARDAGLTDGSLEGLRLGRQGWRMLLLAGV